MCKELFAKLFQRHEQSLQDIVKLFLPQLKLEVFIFNSLTIYCEFVMLTSSYGL
jgi:collagenase-like PrtC family protease